MKIPNLPTDNLYKFLSIFGLILFVFGVYMFKDTPEKLQLLIDKYNVENKIFTHKNDSTSISARNTKIKLQNRKEQLERSIKKLPNSLYFYISIWFIGLIMIFVGFFRWYFKTQIYNDLILKNESKKLERENTNSVNKLLFEKEFLIYEELWESLINLRNKRTLYIATNSNLKGTEKAIKSAYSLFVESFDNCVFIFEKNKPFYSDEIFQETEKMILIMAKEIISIKENKSQEISQKLKKEMKMINIICEKIKKRIKSYKTNQLTTDV